MTDIDSAYLKELRSLGIAGAEFTAAGKIKSVSFFAVTQAERDAEVISEFTDGQRYAFDRLSAEEQAEHLRKAEEEAMFGSSL